MTTELATKAQEAGLVVRSAPMIEGVDGIDDKDLKIGSVVLVQPATTAFVSKGILPGKLANTATESEIKDPTLVVGYLTKLWSLYDNSGATPKWVASSKNENDPIFDGKLRRNDKERKLKAEVIPTILAVGFIEGTPIKVAFKKASGYYAGKDLYGHVRKAGSVFAKKFLLGSKLIPAQNGNPSYYAMTVTVAGDTTPEEQALARQLNAAFQQKPQEIVDADVPF
jgi:hypothetical protein